MEQSGGSDGGGFDSIDSSPPVTPGGKNALLAVALADYVATDDNELTFRKGDIVQILQQAGNGWWKGELRHVVGYFPSTFVHIKYDLYTIEEGETESVGGDLGDFEVGRTPCDRLGLSSCDPMNQFACGRDDKVYFFHQICKW